MFAGNDDDDDKSSPDEMIKLHSPPTEAQNRLRQLEQPVLAQLSIGPTKLAELFRERSSRAAVNSSW